MTTIAANANPERTNKWLLIAGVAMALVTGVLIFLALANLEGGDNAGPSGPGATGSSAVLVAKDNIAAGTKLSADMFRVASFDAADVVPQALSDPQAIIGETTTVDLLKGQQLSRVNLAAATDDKRAGQLAFKIPEGQRAVAVKVDATSAAAGLLVPGDRVDIVVQYKETLKAEPEDRRFIVVHTVLQNVLVLSRDQTDVERVVTLGDNATQTQEQNAANNVPNSEEFQQRPEDIKPDSGLSNLVVALTPDQVQQLIAWDALGDVTASVRRYGEDASAPLDDVRIEVFGSN